MASSYWADKALEPKRNYKWYLSIQTGTTSKDLLQPWVVKSASKPSLSIGEASHSYINHTFYYPGKISWNTMDISVVDPGGPMNDTTKIILNAIRSSGYAYPNEIANNAAAAGVTFSKSAAVDSLGTVVLRQIGGGPVGAGGISKVIDRWTLHNAWIKDVNFGSLSYDNEDLTNISITLRYDWAVHNVGDGIGVPPL